MTALPPKNAKIAVAMSGGVDSAVAALLLVREGFSCTGITMRLYTESSGVCGGDEDIRDAARICETLGIPHTVVDLTDTFRREVIDTFAAAYENGQTPNPCINCNRALKFDALYEYARSLGCDYLATGHYARIAQDEKTGRYLLQKGLDDTKDQGYVLYSLTQEQLAHTLFPLGGFAKAQVRALAGENGFINAAKHDSQDICFVPRGTSYTDFIRTYTGKDYPPGDFVDTHGRLLGRHKGIIHYTKGMRKGLGISSDEPLYVLDVRPADNTVVLGHERDLYADTFFVSDVNLISYASLTSPLRVKVKVRYRQNEQDATVTPHGENGLKVVLDVPARAITCGQSAVLYDGESVVGGGIISSVGALTASEPDKGETP